MIKLTPNLDQDGKYTRLIIGAVLIVGGLLGLGRYFLILVGIVLVAEGVLGFGCAPLVIEKFFKKPPTPPTKP
ncbi:MAG: DUF2892 domain-containing protein [Gammaproteobacteria bacterium]|nr:DUF2892 domain-containing protein [Gammaproteobacteria bacterium]